MTKRTYIEEAPLNIEKEICLCGWINKIRTHGKVIFADLRDKTGIVQVVLSSEMSLKDYEKAKELRPEWVVKIWGVVKKRPENMINHKIKTGGIEILAKKIIVISESKTPPFDLETAGTEISEEIRLKYRYLDLRRPRLQKNIKIRSQYVQLIREFLFENSFLEIETPLLTKSTPEGSRDFVVPSRMYPGKFFALPQSPQQYKQLLMVAGFEKYFQVARAMRDEDIRSNRAFEHSQIDIEMSFVNREEIMKLVEKMTIYALEKIGAKTTPKSFPIITYNEAMNKYGADKFDPRTEEEKKKGIMGFCWVIDFPFFEKNKEGNWTFTHNPFSAPLNAEHEKMLMEERDIDKILTSQFDLVCNGFEVGGGSIRTHKPGVLEKTLSILGHSKENIYKNFGHMIEALNYGAPPHGGFAQGFERLLMAFLNENYIREVQAFPQTGQGRTSVMEAPSEIDEIQLKELGLKIEKKK